MCSFQFSAFSIIRSGLNKNSLGEKMFNSYKLRFILKRKWYAHKTQFSKEHTIYVHSYGRTLGKRIWNIMQKKKDFPHTLNIQRIKVCICNCNQVENKFKVIQNSFPFNHAKEQWKGLRFYKD